MNLLDYALQGWTWNPVVLVSLAAAGIAYAVVIGRRGRWVCFAAAVGLVALALLSPLNLLATGVLFSAHMAQHIILLVFVPALVLLSLPADFGPPTRRVSSSAAGAGRYDKSSRWRHRAPPPNRSPPTRGFPLLGWLLGVGSMWFWHVPEFCNTAASSPPIHAAQTISLLAVGLVYWWPILAPRRFDRLLPGLGIAYLFTACLACTGLGILLTLTPIDVCPIFRAPSTAPALWTHFRTQLTVPRDQQIGGLLMWLPMCLVYVAAIVLELARWLGEAPAEPAVATSHPNP